MSKFKIEKGVELPLRLKYPWNEMAIGDSFLVPHSVDYSNPNSMRAGIQKSALQYAERHDTNFKITTRKLKEGVRVWRIA